MPDKNKTQEILAVYENNYIRAQYTWVQIFTEHLSDCSRVFRGDLVSMLILAIIGQTLLARIIKDGQADSCDVDVSLKPIAQSAINANSIAAVLGIPRETVRRKLDGLRRKGWIERDEFGAWRLAVAEGQARAQSDLHGLDMRGRNRVARLVATFNALAAEHSGEAAAKTGLSDPGTPKA